MDFVYPKSEESTKSKLGPLTVPNTQTSLQKGRWIDHQPVSSVTGNGPIIFFSPCREDYVDLSISAKVTKADGTDLNQNMKEQPVNKSLHSLFEQVDLFLRETSHPSH